MHTILQTIGNHHKDMIFRGVSNDHRQYRCWCGTILLCRRSCMLRSWRILQILPKRPRVHHSLFSVIESLHIKDIIMEKARYSEDKSVREQALMALQKVMIQNWQAIWCITHKSIISTYYLSLLALLTIKLHDQIQRGFVLRRRGRWPNISWEDSCRWLPHRSWPPYL